MEKFLPNAIEQRLPTSEDLRLFVSPIFSGSDPNVLTVTLAEGSLTISGSFAGETQPSSGSHSIIARSNVTTLFQAANDLRRGWNCFNNSGGILYLKLGPGAVAGSDFSVRMPANSLYELPFPTYTGVITGVWASSGGGDAQIDELT